jgi:hypothetical protein
MSRRGNALDDVLATGLLEARRDLFALFEGFERT